MVLSIPGGEFLTGSLDVISQSLTIPVLVILLVIVIITIIEPAICMVSITLIPFLEFLLLYLLSKILFLFRLIY